MTSSCSSRTDVATKTKVHDAVHLINLSKPDIRANTERSPMAFGTNTALEGLLKCSTSVWATSTSDGETSIFKTRSYVLEISVRNAEMPENRSSSANRQQCTIVSFSTWLVGRFNSVTDNSVHLFSCLCISV